MNIPFRSAIIAWSIKPDNTDTVVKARKTTRKRGFSRMMDRLGDQIPRPIMNMPAAARDNSPVSVKLELMRFAGLLLDLRNRIKP